ncbi:MAG: TetR/AcrR family transcriptional regulator [Chloroflexota bacterium]
MKRITKAPDERRNELITTANQLFFTKGYEATSVNDIVKAVGVAKGTFYHYFESKTAVLEALVDNMMSENAKIMDVIVDEDGPTALEKWHKLFEMVGSWKLEHKPELLELAKFMRRDDNALMTKKFEEKSKNIASPRITKIIQQGIDEGVFKTSFAKETAEVIFSLNSGVSQSIVPILLNPEQYDDPLDLLRRKFAAIQAALERILDAPPGTMKFVNEENLAEWYDYLEESRE